MCHYQPQHMYCNSCIISNVGIFIIGLKTTIRASVKSLIINNPSFTVNYIS